MTSRVQNNTTGESLSLPSLQGEESVALFRKVAADVLHANRSTFDLLEPDEKNVVLRWMSQVTVTGKLENSLHNLLWELDYVRKPVLPEQFFTDEYYLGRSMKEIHPRWMEDLCTVLAPDSPCFEWVMTGGIGIGKCVARGTRITTNRGLVPIEVVCADPDGYLVLSESGFRPITQTHFEGRTTTRTITTVGGVALSGRPNHRVRCLVDGNSVWVQLKDVEPGMFVKRVPMPVRSQMTASSESSMAMRYAVTALCHYPDGRVANTRAAVVRAVKSRLPDVESVTRGGLRFSAPVPESAMTTIPEFVWRGSDAVILDYLYPFFACCARNSGKLVSRAIRSKDIAVGASLLFDVLGYPVRIDFRPDSGSYRLIMRKRVAFRYLQITGGVDYSEYVRSAQGGDAYYDEVVSNEVGTHECWDLTVEGDPSYVSNGFVSHNTTIAMGAMAYKLYCLSCVRDPGTYYGLLPDSTIVLGIYSITKHQVNDTGYGKIKGYLDTSPYFRTEFPRNTRIDSKVDFGPTTQKNIQVIAGSTELHAIGLDIFSFCLSARNYVWTASGPIPITELVGNPVRVYTTDGASVYLTEPVEAKVTGYLSVRELRLTTGQTVEATDEHRFLVRRESYLFWVRVKDLIPGDVLLSYAYRGKLYTMKGGSYADMRDLREVPVLLDSTFESRSRYGREGVPDAVSECSVVRCASIESIERGKGDLSDLQEEDALYYSETLEAAWVDTDGICNAVSESKEESSGCAGGVFDKGICTCPGAVEESGVCRSTTERCRESTSQVGSGFSVLPEDRRKSAVCRSCPAFSSGNRTLSQSVRVGSCRVVSPIRDSIQVRAGDSGLHRSGRRCALLYAGLFGGRALCGVSTEMSSRGSVEGGVKRLPGYTVNRRSELEGLGRIPVGESYILSVDEGQVTRELFGLLGHVCDAELSDFCFPVVASVGDLSEPQTVYDIENVPDTHLFFVGCDPTKNPVACHNSMDEVNFMRKKENKETGKMAGQAYALYNQTHARIKSRFMRPGGTIPGLMFLMSSRNSQSDFLEEHLKKNAGSKTLYLSDYALWETKPAHRFIMPKFTVEVGDEHAQSRLLSETDTPREGARVVDVPGEFRKVFEDDVDQGLRDIAGIATYNQSPFIHDRRSVVDSIRDTLTHPFKKEEATLDYKTDTMLSQFLDVRSFFQVKNSRWVPKLNPMAPRTIHIDIALSGDCLGFGMGHVSGMIEHSRVSVEGVPEVVRDPFVVLDMLLRVRPPVGSQIDLSKVRSFILYLMKLGVNIYRVTFDGFQSADSVQILSKQGVDACLLSIDRTTEPYMALRSGLSDRRIGRYAYTPFDEELLNLQRYKSGNRDKVDHPMKFPNGKKGSKDVTDAAAGVVYTCVCEQEMWDSAPLMSARAQRVVDPDTPPSEGEQVGLASGRVSLERLRKLAEE